MRIAYVKSGDVVASLERLSSTASAAADDGGPDAFLDDLLRAMPQDRFLLLGIATVVSRNRAAGRIARRRAFTLAARRRFGGVRNAVRVFSEILKFGPDWIICGKCGFTLWSSYLASRILRVPLFHSRHNWLEEKRPMGRLATVIDNWIVRRVDAVVCHGPYLRARLAGIGVPHNRTFEFDSGNRTLVAQAETVAGGAPVTEIGGHLSVLYVGRMVRQKGIFDLLEACTRLFPELPRLRLVYAGSGIDMAGLREEAVRRGVSERIHFLGRVSHAQLGCVMQQSRLVVTPTRSSFPEGRCMVVMEALAVGTPVVAPRFGPFPYLVRHCVNGLLYQPDSVDELAAMISRALLDEGLYQVLASGARQSGAALLQPEVSYSQALGRALALVRT